MIHTPIRNGKHDKQKRKYRETLEKHMEIKNENMDREKRNSKLRQSIGERKCDKFK